MADLIERACSDCAAKDARIASLERDVADALRERDHCATEAVKAKRERDAALAREGEMRKLAATILDDYMRFVGVMPSDDDTPDYEGHVETFGAYYERMKAALASDGKR